MKEISQLRRIFNLEISRTVRISAIKRSHSIAGSSFVRAQGLEIAEGLLISLKNSAQNLTMFGLIVDEVHVLGRYLL